MKVIVPRCRSGPVIFSLLSINLDGLMLFRGCIRVINSVTPRPSPVPYSSNFVNWLVVQEVGVEILLTKTWPYLLHLRILTLSSKSLRVILLPKAMAHYTCSIVSAANSIYVVNEGARDGEWWEHSPPTNVVRFHVDLTPYVDWVCCWFSPLL